MRQIGAIETQEQAQLFQDFLLTQGVSASVEDNGAGWTVWVHDEDRLDEARRKLDEFLGDPRAKRYQDATEQAAAIRDEQIQESKQARKRTINVRERWNQPATSSCPATFTLIALSVFVAFFSRLGASDEPLQKYLYFAQGPRPEEILNGEVWRIFTPMLLHFGIMHIVFNMMWLRLFGLTIEYRKGTARFLAIVLTIAAVSNASQFYMSGGGFGGMSGVNYGLFGYIWAKGKYDPESGMYMPRDLVFWLMLWFVLCLTGWVGPIANTAHAMGLVSGIALALVPLAGGELFRR